MLLAESKTLPHPKQLQPAGGSGPTSLLQIAVAAPCQNGERQSCTGIPASSQTRRHVSGWNDPRPRCPASETASGFPVLSPKGHAAVGPQNVSMNRVRHAELPPWAS